MTLGLTIFSCLFLTNLEEGTSNSIACINRTFPDNADSLAVFGSTQCLINRKMLACNLIIRQTYQDYLHLIVLSDGFTKRWLGTVDFLYHSLLFAKINVV